MVLIVKGVITGVFLLLTAVAVATLAYVEMSRERSQCDGVGSTDTKNTALAACVGFLVVSALVAFSYYRSMTRQDNGAYGWNMAASSGGTDELWETSIVFIFLFATFALSAILLSYILKVKDSMKGVDTADQTAVDASCGGFADATFNDMAIAGAAILLSLSLLALIYPYGLKLIDIIYKSTHNGASIWDPKPPQQTF